MNWLSSIDVFIHPKCLRDLSKVEKNSFQSLLGNNCRKILDLTVFFRSLTKLEDLIVKYLLHRLSYHYKDKIS